MTRDLTRALARAPAFAAAATLLAASAACNALFGSSFGTGPIEIALLVGASLASDVLKAACPVALRAAIRDRDLVTVLAAIAVLCITIAYSGLAAVGFAASARETTASERQSLADTHERAASSYEAAEAELAALGVVRPSAEIVSEITGIEALPGILINGVPCGGQHDGPTTREHCPRHAVLKAELAKAQAREGAIERREAARRKLDDLMGAPAVADPQGEAVATYLGIIGIRMTSAELRPWLVAIAALLVEVGSVLGFLVASAGGRDQARGGLPDGEPDTAAHDSGGATAVQEKVAKAPSSKRQRQKRPRGQRFGQASSVGRATAEARIVETLKGHGGRIEGATVRSLAALIGGRKSTVHSALAGLVGAGVVARLGGELVLCS